MYGDFMDGVVALFFTCVIAVPLAIWKLVDIGIWLYHHVSIAWH